MIKRTATLAIVTALLASIAFARQANQSPRTWAVVIGISKYQKLPGGQQLQFAERDAALISEAIQKLGVGSQNVRLLTGTEATTAAIKSSVGNWLARSVTDSDTVLIFFSGHGMFEREFGESYLLGYDSDPKDPYGTALSVSELTQALTKRLRAGKVLVIADAARRDFFDPDTDPNLSNAFAESFDQLASARQGISTIIASSPGEFSREGQRWGGHGVFAKHLADVLLDGANRNGDPATAADELFGLLKDRVADDTAGKQHPVRHGSAGALSDVARKGPAQNRTTAPANSTIASQTNPKAPTSEPKKDPVVAADKKTIQPPPATPDKKTQPAPAGASPRSSDSTPALASATRANPVETTSPKKTEISEPARNPNSNDIKPSPSVPKPSEKKTTATSPVGGGLTPPGTGNVRVKEPNVSSGDSSLHRDIPVSSTPAAPRPTIVPPSTGGVASNRTTPQPETMRSSVPTERPEAAPSPLILQLEAAIATKNLLEPKNNSAWDLYQRMLSEPGAAADASRLRPVLADALLAQGRVIVGGDVRADNVSDRVDEFKRAGQMLARARSIAPENSEVIALEKLSAAEALLALQFYDEAERALSPLQTAKLAPVENALGLVYLGKLDTYRAERAFKRASEIDPKWAIPHYNLALLYRSQQNQASLAELEAAVNCDQINVSIVTALGDEYFARQQWKQSADTFRKAVALRPNDDNLHTKLGHALYSLGSQDEANREYQKAQELRRKQ